jgi:ribosomal protein S27AE
VTRASDLDIAHHKHRLARGIYPREMEPVVRELLAEIERVRNQRDEIDETFYAWRHRPSQATPRACPDCGRLDDHLMEDGSWICESCGHVEFPSQATPERSE